MSFNTFPSILYTIVCVLECNLSCHTVHIYKTRLFELLFWNMWLNTTGNRSLYWGFFYFPTRISKGGRPFWRRRRGLSEYGWGKLRRKKWNGLLVRKMAEVQRHSLGRNGLCFNGLWKASVRARMFIFICMLLVEPGRATTHWVVTEDGKIQQQVRSVCVWLFS